MIGNNVTAVTARSRKSLTKLGNSRSRPGAPRLDLLARLVFLGVPKQQISVFLGLEETRLDEQLAELSRQLIADM